jgi:phosphopantothenoylcysteine decarboxylase/phosphopantothenate--cysteine ligase
MQEPLAIIEALQYHFSPKILQNCSVVITAGPTQEAIDPVRYLTNRSSGKMGYALAEAASAMGAAVTLISGPTHLCTPLGVSKMMVATAEEMHQAVMDIIPGCNIFIGAAAVADYRCVQSFQQKIKKTGDKIVLELVRNPDIVATVASLPKKPFIVGFAAETHDLLANAKAKLQRKQLDMIAANYVGDVASGFDSEYNQLIVLWQDGQREFPLTSKKALAYEFLLFIAEQFHAKNST